MLSIPIRYRTNNLDLHFLTTPLKSYFHSFFTCCNRTRSKNYFLRHDRFPRVHLRSILILFVFCDCLLISCNKTNVHAISENEQRFPLCVSLHRFNTNLRSFPRKSTREFETLPIVEKMIRSGLIRCKCRVRDLLVNISRFKTWNITFFFIWIQVLSHLLITYRILTLVLYTYTYGP